MYEFKQKQNSSFQSQEILKYTYKNVYICPTHRYN